MICQAVRPLIVYESLFVVCRGWLCWLAMALALKLPLAGIVFPQALHAVFALGE
jgi:hypothetical protein